MHCRVVPTGISHQEATRYPSAKSPPANSSEGGLHGIESLAGGNKTRH